MKRFLTVFICLLPIVCYGKSLSPFPKILSLDECGDQFALAMGQTENIIGLSRDADNPTVSIYAHLANNIPQHRGGADKILSLQPTVVIGNQWTAPRLQKILKKSGIDFIPLTFPQSWQGVIDETKKVAEVLGQDASPYVENITSISPLPSYLRGLYLTPGGYSVGKDTLINQVMENAGLRNVIKKAGWVSVSTEEIIAYNPEVILVSFYEGRQKSLAGRELETLKRLLPRANIIPVPQNLLICSTWKMADAVGYIQRRL